MIKRLHYITQDIDGVDHSELAEKACQGGAKLIVLRAPRKSYKELLPMANKTLKICRKFEASLIINSNVMLAKEIGADGVQLGVDDMPIDQARMLLGDEAYIGGAANNVDEIEYCMKLGASYVYVGPFSYTHSKYRHLNTLGFAGYRDIVCQMRQKGLDIPLFAKGGIAIDDVPFLSAIGLYGVAVSTAISSGDLIENTLDFIEEVNAR